MLLLLLIYTFLFPLKLHIYSKITYFEGIIDKSNNEMQWE